MRQRTATDRLTGRIRGCGQGCHRRNNGDIDGNGGDIDNIKGVVGFSFYMRTRSVLRSRSPGAAAGRGPWVTPPLDHL